MVTSFMAKVAKLPTSCLEVLDFVACLMRPFLFVFVILRSFHPIELVNLLARQFC